MKIEVEKRIDPMKRVFARIPRAQAKKLRQIAFNRGESLSKIVCAAVEKWMEENS